MQVGSDSEYAGWDKYRKFFYSYETEQEYINYFEELSNKLKVCLIQAKLILYNAFDSFFWANILFIWGQWMEGYVLIEETSLKVSLTI